MRDESVEKVKAIVREEISHVNAELVKATKKLLDFKTECIPEHFKKNYGYSKGDEGAPFFSQAFLYTLLGKEDARTLLALMRPVWVAAGIDRANQP